MNNFENYKKHVYEKYEQLCLEDKENPDYALNLIKTLKEIISNSKETTHQGLTQLIKTCSDYIIDQAQEKQILGTKTNLSISSVAHIFQHQIQKGLRTYVGGDNMKDITKNLILISNESYQIISKSKQKISSYSLEFLQNGLVIYSTFYNNFKTILIFSFSSVVAETLIQGSQKGIKFQCIICETRPNQEGYKMFQKLSEKGIYCRMIIDSAIGYALEEADIVLSGAEAVVENGGIINRIGTYTIALCAKSLKKPFYVVTESYKFTRIYPLQQKDLPEKIQEFSDAHGIKNKFVDSEKIRFSNPLCDFTPPNLITLFFTDIGIFTPAAISDELYQTFNN